MAGMIDVGKLTTQLAKDRALAHNRKVMANNAKKEADKRKKAMLTEDNTEELIGDKPYLKILKEALDDPDIKYPRAIVSDLLDYGYLYTMEHKPTDQFLVVNNTQNPYMYEKYDGNPKHKPDDTILRPLLVDIAYLQECNLRLLRGESYKEVMKVHPTPSVAWYKGTHNTAIVLIPGYYISFITGNGIVVKSIYGHKLHINKGHWYGKLHDQILELEMSGK